MNNSKPALSVLHEKLGYKSLNRTWAKGEIVLGLGAAGAGLLLGNWALSHPSGELPWQSVLGAWALFVLGGYLTLAGHRSHLYQSNNELTAYLAEELQRLKEKVESP
jgi:hypothetical protein